MKEWKAGKPFLNESQLRALVAIREGCVNLDTIAKRIHRNKSHVSEHVVSPLRDWGLIAYMPTAKVYKMLMPWDEVVAEVLRRSRWFYKSYEDSLRDILEVPSDGA